MNKCSNKNFKNGKKCRPELVIKTAIKVTMSKTSSESLRGEEAKEASRPHMSWVIHCKIALSSVNAHAVARPELIVGRM